jgi:diguanylate cyclase (GGDEF)-like protein
MLLKSNLSTYLQRKVTRWVQIDTFKKGLSDAILIQPKTSFLKEVVYISLFSFVLFLLFRKLITFDFIVSVFATTLISATIVNVCFIFLTIIIVLLRHSQRLKADISLRVMNEAELSHLAFYDQLTGLPNRALCQDRLTQYISHAKRNKNIGALLFIDLDNFKQVNDLYGHGSGDDLLIQFSQRLLAKLRTEDTLSRLSGDEFVIIIDSPKDIESVANIAKKLLNSLDAPFFISGNKLYVSMSMGIAIYPQDAQNVEDALKCADAAMYNAKREGKGTFSFYSKKLQADRLFKTQLTNNLLQALPTNELSISYQPVIALTGKHVIGAEALLRWNNAELGNVQPQVFIPIAEEIGLIDEIGSWVLNQACEQAVAWHTLGFDQLVMSVNMSAKQLAKPDIVETVEKALQHSGLAAKFLEIELTETTLLKDTNALSQKLKGLKELGIAIAIDDFGTGFSSISTLVNRHISRLKIDKCFIDNLPSNEHNVMTTTAIISLAKNLGLKVTAEGVESNEQALFLEQTQCDSLQGFFHSAPLNPEDFKQYLNDSIV